jgi:hypothetical protein
MIRGEVLPDRLHSVDAGAILPRWAGEDFLR